MNNITDEELAMLEACQSKQDWSEATKKIKGAREQAYPDDWWDKVKLSGMMGRIVGRWGEDSEIKVSSHPTFDDLLKEMEKYPHRDNHMD